MSKRLVRAKRTIRNARIPYRTPSAHLLRERAHAVGGVLSLLFSEQYLASIGTTFVRQELRLEAVRLVRMLAELTSDEPDVRGSLAASWNSSQPFAPR